MIIVTDNTNPVITTPQNAYVPAIDANGTPMTDAYVQAFLNAATVLDNVDVGLTISNDASTTLSLGATTITFSATDAYGNIGTATAIITITDQTAPVITPPSNVYVPTINANGIPLTDPYVLTFINAVTAIDNVDVYTTINNDSPATLPLGATTVTFSATDAYGNTGSSSAIITVVDQTLPIVTAPADLSPPVAAVDGYGTPATDPYIAVFLLGATVSDNVDVGLVASNNAPAVLPLGLTTVIFSVTDAYGNTGTATAVINITDQTNPIVAPPQNITIAAIDAAGTAVDPYVLAFMRAATATDNVAVANIVNNAPAVLPLGATTVTFTATDVYGNTGSASSIVTVTDQTIPVITILGNNPLFVALGNTFIDPGTTVSDNVDVGLIATATGTVNMAAVGIYPIAYNISDAAGNIALTVTRTVHVTDLTPPIVTPPTNITVAAQDMYGTAANNAAITTFLAGATAFDLVDGTVPASPYNAPTIFPLGSTTVTFQATDLSGSRGTATATILVTDQTAPVINLLSGSNDPYVLANPYIVAQGSVFSEPGTRVTDNVDANFTAIATGTVNTQILGTYLLSYNANDAANNAAAMVIRTINVMDKTAPVITVPQIDTYVFATDVYGIALTDGYVQTFLNKARARDNVANNLPVIANDAYTFVDIYTNFIPVGIYPITFSVTDNFNNTGTAQARMIVVDGNPRIDTYTGVNHIIVAAVDMNGTPATDPYITSFFTGTTAWDLVDSYIQVSPYNAPAIFALGINPMSFITTDSYGNTVTKAVTIEVIDQAKPIMTLIGNTALTIPQGFPFIDPGVSIVDNVDVGLIATKTSTVNTAVLGSYTFIYNVSDKYGNAAIPVTRQVTVTDQTAPVITIKGANPMTIAQGSIFIDPGTLVTDNVDIGLIAMVTGGVSNLAPITNLINYNVTDAAGNVALVATRTVIVTDQTAPIITINGANPMTIAQGSIFADPGTLVTDNVDTGLLATPTGTVNTAVLGIYTISYNAVDTTSHAAIPVTRTVHVTDQTAPTITLVGKNPLTTVQGRTFIDPGVTVVDNVDIGLTAATSGAVNTKVFGSYTLNYSVTDAAGNNTLATRTVNVSADTIAPVVSAPANIDLYSLSPNGLPANNIAIATMLNSATANDNIAVNVVVNNDAPSIFPIGTTTVTFTARDIANNIGTATATVTVIANHRPVAMPNTAVTIADQYVQINNVLANDTDVDGQLLSVISVDIYSQAGATVMNNADTFIYTPYAGFTGMDMFKYQIADGVGGIALGKVTVSVKPNLNPVVDPYTGSMPPVLLRNGNNGVIMQVNSTKELLGFIVNDIYANANPYTYAATPVTPFNALDPSIGATMGVPFANVLTLVAGATAGTDSVRVTVTDPYSMLTSSIIRTVTVQDVYAAGNTPAPAGDGLTLTQKQTLHLDPYSIDTDNDGTPDAEEIGDPANPFDLDGDGVIDALEPSGDSDDYSKAFGMRDQYGNAVGIDSYGNTLTSVSLSPAPATLSKPAGIVSDMISYEARLPSNVYAAVSKFVFSTPLPAVIEPYKVDASGVYTIIPAFNTTMPNEGWMQIDAYTLELTLKDGGVFDQDGVINGIVVDPLVIASGVLVPVAAAALPTLLSPIDKATAVTLDATGGVVLQWTKPVTVSTTATYELLLATDAAFTNVIQTIPVTTIVLASNVMPFMLVGVAFGMLAWYRRRHIVLVVLVLACAALISCSSGGSGGTVPPTTTIPATTAPTITKPAPVTPPVGSVLSPNTQQQTLSGLQAGTTYFWKIVVTEANGATADSQVWSFTTK
ncbi:MAG: DUF5011 domain-containing protein [Mariprofundales bacterium]